MKGFALVVFCVLVQPSEGVDVEMNVTATPRVIIPGLDPSLVIRCDPAAAADDFRQIFFLQLEKLGSSGSLVPIATLSPGQAAASASTSPDPRLKVNGNLDNSSPDTSFILVNVEKPTADDAGRYVCNAVGLGTNGNQVTHTQHVDVTVDPESSQVDAFLKAVVWDLKQEAQRLVAEAQALQAQNQRLAAHTASRRQALAQKKRDVETLRTQVGDLESQVKVKQAALTLANQRLVQEIGNVSRDAPAQRVAFNAVERTEKTYTSGQQVMLESVELNEGDGYNATSATLVPPVDGMYFFTSGQLTHDLASAAYRVYTIRRNSTILAGTYNADDRQGSTFQQSSTSGFGDIRRWDQMRLYQQWASSSTTALLPYQATPQARATNFAGYLVY